jgi:hypothetical protein
MSVDRFVAYQRTVARAAEARRRATAATIRARLGAVVDELAQLGAGRIVLFGSVARGEADDDSDIDLAVEDLPATALFEAMARAWTAAGRPVDIVRLEEATPSLRARILADGEVLRDAG